ncbi:hypothetical protein GWN42_05010 [candidate division KSB1 bacterium]|nr:hypothetical protein [Phycisphaerae bacterium]NIV92163.1 hypothetical protein [candidate division KSB1 bacterium]
MARFPERLLNQTAVYWGSPVEDGSGGYTYADPVEISCRWVEKNEVITVNTGDELVSRSQVQIAQDVDEEGLLFLGDLDDLDSSEEDDPSTVEAAYRIRKFDKIPTIRAGKTQRYFRKAYL